MARAAGRRSVLTGSAERRLRHARAVAASRAPRTVAVVGAGLAGAPVARALADEGIDVVFVEAAASVASGASAVAAGVFHAAFGDANGAHGRLARAASFEVARDARRAIDAGLADGRIDGVLRVAELPSTGDPPPGSEVEVALEQRLDVAEARALTGVPLATGGRWMRLAGVVEPRGLVRAWLAAAGTRARLLTGRAAAAIVPVGDRWRVLDAGGIAVVEADAVVVAAGTATPALLAPWGAAQWPLRHVRGQTSRAPAGTWRGTGPLVPLTGDGQAFVDARGGLVFGATSEAIDGAASRSVAVRASDHAFNVERLHRLLGASTGIRIEALEGAVGVRLSAADRLPIIGAVPVPLAGDGLLAPGLQQPRQVPRVPGLFVCSAFGARGVLWSSLAGRLVAASVSGATPPVPGALVDAVDPARFTSRLARRAVR